MIQVISIMGLVFLVWYAGNALRRNYRENKPMTDMVHPIYTLLLLGTRDKIESDSLTYLIGLANNSSHSCLIYKTSTRRVLYRNFEQHSIPIGYIDNSDTDHKNVT